MRMRYLLSPPALAHLNFLNCGLLSVVAVTAFFLQGSIGFAQSADPFEDLRVRIDQLEQDNKELRTAFSKKSDSDSFVPMISDLPPTPSDYEEANTSPDDKKMESLVEGLIRRMNAQNKAMTDLQDQKIAALERQVASMNKAPKPTAATGNFGNGGLLFTSIDGNFKTHFGGTAQLDFIAPESTARGITTPGGAYGNQDSTNFRRLRMRADGTMYGNIDWVSEFDFAAFDQNTSQLAANLADNGLRSFPTGVNQQGGNTFNVIQPTTVFIQYNHSSAINSRIGNQQDWFSIEHITSARYLDFMERAQIMDVFSGPNNNGYTPGVSFFGNTPDKMMGYQVGIYKNNAYDSDYTFSLGNAFTYGGRAIWTPYYEECGNNRYLLHTGFGAEYRSFDTDLAANQLGQNIRLRSRGDLRIASATLTPNFSDTGNFYAIGQEMIDPEVAFVWGSWKVQAEYTTGWFNGARTNQGGKSLGNVIMSGGYAEALYFLTGESYSYNRQTGAFGQIVPIQNANFSQGTHGAWQLGTRIDWVDMNSGLIAGGKNQSGTIGLNWYLNPNIRFQFNVVGTYIENAASPVIAASAGNPGSAVNGSLQGAKFVGDGLIMTVGTRMDISF